MYKFGIMYPLGTLTKDMDLVKEYEEKEKVIIKGKDEYSSFFAIFRYLETIEGTDWFQLMQFQQVRLQESSL